MFLRLSELKFRQKHPDCRAINFPDLTLLPIKSVIDMFYNTTTALCRLVGVMAQIKFELLLELVTGMRWQSQIQSQLQSSSLLQ